MNNLSALACGFVVFQGMLLLATLGANDGNCVLSSRRTRWLRVLFTLCAIVCLIFPLFAMEGMGILLILFHCMLVEYLGEYGNERLGNGKGWNYTRHRTFYLVFSLVFLLVFAICDGIRHFASEGGSLRERIVKCTVFSSMADRRRMTKSAGDESGRVGAEVVKSVSPSVGTEASVLGRSIRVSLMEDDSEGLDRSQILSRYRDGKGTVVFSAVFTPDGGKVCTETRWVLIPMGFQRGGSSRGKPNPMNFAKRGLGTRVSMRERDGDPLLFTFEREYVVGLEAARAATPGNFVEPTVKTMKLDFEIPSSSTDFVAGGGWHEDAPDKVYYVVASWANRSDSVR